MKRIAVAWAALLALMLASLASAYVPLGAWNLVIGLAIAGVKCAVVLGVFMRLGAGPTMIRFACAVAVLMLALLGGLSALDAATRRTEPAVMQPPQQLRPLNEGAAVR